MYYPPWLIFLQNYDGSFVNLIKKCNNSGKQLIDLVLQDFTSFCDTAVYKQQKGIVFSFLCILPFVMQHNLYLNIISDLRCFIFSIYF